MTAGGRRGFAVLGQMTELGEEAQGFHEEVGRLAAQAGVAALIVVGEAAAPILTGTKSVPSWSGELLHVADNAGRGRGRWRSGCRPATSCWSRPRTRSACEAVALAPDRRAAGRRSPPREDHPRGRRRVAAAGAVRHAAAIRLLRRRGYGQLIREEGPAAHQTKRGTPTMGGAVIVIATLIGYVVGHVVTNDPISVSGLLVLALMTGLGLVGFIDDFIKIYKQTSLGLRSGAKLAGQAVVGALFALEVLRHPDGFDLSPADAHFSFLRDFGPRSACCRS